MDVGTQTLPAVGKSTPTHSSPGQAAARFTTSSTRSSSRVAERCAGSSARCGGDDTTGSSRVPESGDVGQEVGVNGARHYSFVQGDRVPQHKRRYSES